MIFSSKNIRYTLPLTTLFLLISCDNSNNELNAQEKPVSTNYTCENSWFINVTYSRAEKDSLSAEVDYNNKVFKLARVRSASGERYSDGTTTWWSKGDTGFLQIGDEIVLKNCIPKKPGKQMHPSWDKNNDSINDCESEGSCDHTIDYTMPRAS